MRKITSITAVLVLAAALAGCGGSDGAGATDEVKLAGLWPLSGPNATQGTDVLHGAELAVEIVNNDHPGLDLPLGPGKGLPGLGGAPVKLITGDTQGKPEVGAGEVDRLVTGEKVAAVIGSYQSGVTLTASQRAERLGVPFVNEASSSVALTERGLKWFFRTGPTDETFARSMFDYLKARQAAGDQIRSVGVFHSNDQFGNDGAGVTEKVAAEAGLPVSVNVGFDPTAADLGSQVAQVRSKSPDVLFVLAYTDAAIKLMKTLDQLDYYPPALLAYGTGFADPAFATGLGALADGASTRAAWSGEIAEKRPAAKTVAELFQQRYGAPMTENSARAFTAVLALAQAIDTAKSVEPAKIRDALRGLDIPGDKTIMPWTGIRFDDKGQNTGAAGVVEQMIEGKYRVVFPAELSSVQPIWPMNKAQQ
ncbi:ABC transporter substrate-binding protein [Plantactinospora mayteni]|uniref:Amino acid ABC transporter substrate-binding protein n=1 Tax=Plantactinospora mayteni TaxID=566021 RepID=A0ABQ4EWF2_9ACTN|nr:ABC transporter substrate-binding protein [Plantactinospora mayteni]GIG98999.1 amino acid ABC transporter substrate-binding protein [Plantactinospora mayteni]